MKPEDTVAALNEAVRGKGGLQDNVESLQQSVRELLRFRDTIIGVQIAIGFLSPLLAHYLLQ